MQNLQTKKKPIPQEPESMRSIEANEPAPPPVNSAGTTLKNAREQWGLSLAEVAENLNLGSDTIEAIEADNYSSLPGTTFVKGYIRSYAKLLQLDVEGLMGNIDLQPERITEIPSTRAALRLKGKTRNREKSKKKSGFLKWLMILIFLAVAFFGILQLPKLGIEPIDKLLNQIGVKTETSTNPDGSTQLIIPSNTGNDSNSEQNATQPSNSTPSDQPKGALIRIE